MRRNRSSFSFPDFSLRRLLLQGARAARGSPTLGNRCDIEKGTSTSSKGEKTSSTSSNKVSVRIDFSFLCRRGEKPQKLFIVFCLQKKNSLKQSGKNFQRREASTFERQRSLGCCVFVVNFSLARKFIFARAFLRGANKIKTTRLFASSDDIEHCCMLSVGVLLTRS